jgi:hypothetical protein
VRAAPAVSVKVAMSAPVRTGVGVIGLVATFVTLAWASADGGLRFAVPLASLALTLHLLIELHAAPERRLRWDGADWWLRAERAGADERRGELMVACDLGHNLLLRFVPAGSRRIGSGVWLPLRRSEVEGDWHALRCALYSPRAPLVAASEALDA